MKCHQCNGTGKTGLIHFNKGFNEQKGGCDGEWRESMPCLPCDGSGQVPDEMADWIAFGKDFREKRRSRGETIGQAATRLKLSVPQLSAIENGRVNYALYLQTMS